jgi:hypothetical protein
LRPWKPLASHAFAVVAPLKRLGADALALENSEMIELHLDEAASVRQSLHHALLALHGCRPSRTFPQIVVRRSMRSAENEQKHQKYE